MEEKEHLFSKNLNDLSTGQLKDLYDGIDKLFVAIKRSRNGCNIQVLCDPTFILVSNKLMDFINIRPYTASHAFFPSPHLYHYQLN